MFTFQPLADFYNSVPTGRNWQPNTVNNLILLATFFLNAIIIRIRIQHSGKNAKLAALLNAVGNSVDGKHESRNRNGYTLKVALKLTVISVIPVTAIFLNRHFLHEYFGKGPVLALVYFGVPCAFLATIIFENRDLRARLLRQATAWLRAGKFGRLFESRRVEPLQTVSMSVIEREQPMYLC